jgi:lysophospholipase L1-like esterase
MLELRRSGLLLATTLCLTTACGTDIVNVGSTASGNSSTESSTSSSAGVGGATTSTSSAAGGENAGGNGQGPTAAECFMDSYWALQPKYDQFKPTIGSHCKGTNHQNIEGIERVVFLGDSITQGTPPTPNSQVYRQVLSAKLEAKFPGVQIDECAVNGARVRDLLKGDEQILNCFPQSEQRKTLVIMTMGGNDIIRWAQNNMSQEVATADADVIAADFREAIDWFYADPTRFPNGVNVVFGNIYEYTDGTAELGSCLGAALLGLSGSYIEGAPVLQYLNEQYMRIAVETGTDMIFMLEEFCGHGYKRKDDTITCYRGPNAEQWFDISCIHPTPAGHAALADLFMTVVEE